MYKGSNRQKYTYIEDKSGGEISSDLGNLGKIQTSLPNPKKRKSDYKMPEKTYWHIYSLQTLNTEKFIKVVDKILKKEYILIK